MFNKAKKELSQKLDKLLREIMEDIGPGQWQLLAEVIQEMGQDLEILLRKAGAWQDVMLLGDYEQIDTKEITDYDENDEDDIEYEIVIEELEDEEELAPSVSLSEINEYEVWCEGDSVESAEGDTCSEPVLLGRAEGISFMDACVWLLKYDKYFNHKTMTYDGKDLFPTKEQVLSGSCRKLKKEWDS